MRTVTSQLKQNMHRLVKSIIKDFVITHKGNSGTILYKSNILKNYYDVNVFYTFDRLDTFDEYKLIFTCDFGNKFDSINNSIITINDV